jgi:hypothetical protein
MFISTQCKLCLYLRNYAILYLRNVNYVYICECKYKRKPNANVNIRKQNANVNIRKQNICECKLPPRPLRPLLHASSASTAPLLPHDRCVLGVHSSHDRASQSPRQSLTQAHTEPHTTNTTKKISKRQNSMCGNYIEKSFGRTIVRPKDSSAEQSFGRDIFRPKTYCRKENIRPTKFLHANRGPGYGSVRFDVYVFGRTIVRPKIISFGRKIYLVRPKICFSKFWRPDCHESVTHLRDSTLFSKHMNNLLKKSNHK